MLPYAPLGVHPIYGPLDKFKDGEFTLNFTFQQAKGQEDVNGEKLTVKKWWIFGADFFTVWCRFFHDFWCRFFTVYKPHKRWKQKTSRYRWAFSRLAFHGLPPLEKVFIWEIRGHPCRSSRWIGSKKKPINRKHINILLTALVGQSSQGRTPTRPRDKRDKMAILLWNSTEKGRFVPGTGPILSRGGLSHLSQGRFLFVPDTVPPKMFMFIGFFLARVKYRSFGANFVRRNIFREVPVRYF